MKNILSYAFLLITVLLHACGKKDALLLGQLPSTTVVNPDVKVLIKDNDLLDAQLTGNGIRGFTKTDVFFSADGFQHFTTTPYSMPASAPLRRIEGNSVIMSSNYPTTTPI